MGKLVIHTNPDVSRLELERTERFVSLSPEEKLNSLFSLIELSVALNNGKPLKSPQAKGIVIKKLI